MSIQADKQTDEQAGRLTGFPSVDKPWTRFYTQAEKDAAIAKAEDYYSSKELDPNSIAATARLVKAYNEKNNK